MKKVCCFTGHRQLSKEKLPEIMERLERVVDRLIGEGYTDFISGGAIGFDTLAAFLVLEKKRAGHGIRLILAVPCKDQDRLWTAQQKENYRAMISGADEVAAVSEEAYAPGCMAERNRYMVDRADCVIACYYRRNSGTFQTVKETKRKGKRIINIALP